MFCTFCGSSMEDGSQFCSKCGKSTNPMQAQPYQTSHNPDTGNIGWGVLGFFVPLVGLILYLIWQTERPKDAKMAGKGALIGVCVSVGLGILSFIFSMILLSAFASSFHFTSILNLFTFIL